MEAKVEQLEPKKRRKVRTNPNSKFAGIKAIKKAQIKARNRQIEVEDSNVSTDSSSTLFCIEIKE